MIATLIRGFKKLLCRFRSGKILNRIGSGKEVYFENLLEKTAIKYIPGGKGKPGKYSVKRIGQNEREIEFESPFFLDALFRGKPISKARYCNFNLIKGLPRNLEKKTPVLVN
jgi:hypothetical protein